jgi:hypothetical protein
VIYERNHESMVPNLKILSIINKRYDRHMIQTKCRGDYTSSSITTPWTKERFTHHDARHGTVEMVDASDEAGSSLSFNFGGAVANSQRPPSSWRPPLGLAMIYLKCPPLRVSLIVDSLFLGNSEGLDDVFGEWQLAHAIRVAST